MNSLKKKQIKMRSDENVVVITAESHPKLYRELHTLSPEARTKIERYEESAKRAMGNLGKYRLD